jgi:hypothetical protein
MNYQVHFTERVSQYLQQLDNELNEDIPRLGELIPDITLGQADTYVSRVADLLNNYNEMFHPATKRSNSGGTRTNWYARKKELEGYDSKIEATLPTIFEKEGYVTAPLVQQYTGIEEAEAVKRLKSLSRKYKWKVKQDPQKPEVVRYSPAKLPKNQASTPADDQERRVI